MIATKEQLRLTVELLSRRSAITMASYLDRKNSDFMTSSLSKEDEKTAEEAEKNLRMYHKLMIKYR